MSSLRVFPLAALAAAGLMAGVVPRAAAAADTVAAFAIGRHEVTVREWSRFATDTGRLAVANSKRCTWNQPGIAQDELHPATCMDWHDAQAYTAWLSRKTGQRYRLPEDYRGAPTDGLARTTGACDRRVVRGGSWDQMPRGLRSGRRDHAPADLQWHRGDAGLRVARDLDNGQATELQGTQIRAALADWRDAANSGDWRLEPDGRWRIARSLPGRLPGP